MMKWRASILVVLVVACGEESTKGDGTSLAEEPAASNQQEGSTAVHDEEVQTDVIRINLKDPFPDNITVSSKEAVSDLYNVMLDSGVMYELKLYLEYYERNITDEDYYGWRVWNGPTITRGEDLLTIYYMYAKISETNGYRSFVLVAGGVGGDLQWGVKAGEERYYKWKTYDYVEGEEILRDHMVEHSYDIVEIHADHWMSTTHSLEGEATWYREAKDSVPWTVTKPISQEFPPITH